MVALVVIGTLTDGLWNRRRLEKNTRQLGEFHLFIDMRVLAWHFLGKPFLDPAGRRTV